MTHQNTVNLVIPHPMVVHMVKTPRLVCQYGWVRGPWRVEGKSRSTAQARDFTRGGAETESLCVKCTGTCTAPSGASTLCFSVLFP